MFISEPFGVIQLAAIFGSLAISHLLHKSAVSWRIAVSPILAQCRDYVAVGDQAQKVHDPLVLQTGKSLRMGNIQ